MATDVLRRSTNAAITAIQDAPPAAGLITGPSSRATRTGRREPLHDRGGGVGVMPRPVTAGKIFDGCERFAERQIGAQKLPEPAVVASRCYGIGQARTPVTWRDNCSIRAITRVTSPLGRILSGAQPCSQRRSTATPKARQTKGRIA